MTITKQLQIYQYVTSGHTNIEAAHHFGCTESYVSRCVKIESGRHGVAWVDKRKYVPRGRND